MTCCCKSKLITEKKKKDRMKQKQNRDLIFFVCNKELRQSCSEQLLVSAPTGTLGDAAAAQHNNVDEYQYMYRYSCRY